MLLPTFRLLKITARFCWKINLRPPMFKPSVIPTCTRYWASFSNWKKFLLCQELNLSPTVCKISVIFGQVWHSLFSTDISRSFHPSGVFAYIEWETRQYSRMVNMRRSHLLKAYGLLKRLVSSLLSSVSDNKPRLSVYSGHDYTLRYLAVTLGLYTDATASPIYASRFIIEVSTGHKGRIL